MEVILKVTDHAVVRYLERILGYDIDLIRDAIATKAIKAQIKKLGPNGEFINGNHRVVIKNSTAVTVKELGMI